MRCRQSRTVTEINRQINELGVQSGDSSADVCIEVRDMTSVQGDKMCVCVHHKWCKKN